MLVKVRDNTLLEDNLEDNQSEENENKLLGKTKQSCIMGDQKLYQIENVYIEINSGFPEFLLLQQCCQ